MAVLVLVLLVGLVHNAWAATYLGYTAGNCSTACPISCNSETCTNNVCAVGQACESVGQIVIAPFAGTLQSVSFLTSPASCGGSTCGLPNQLIIMTAPANSLSHLSSPSGVPCATGSCGKEGSGDTFTVADVETLSGLSVSTFTTVVLAGTVTVTANQFVAITVLSTAGENINTLTGLNTCPCSTTVYMTHITTGSIPSCTATTPIVNSFIVGNTVCSDLGDANQPIIGGTFIPSTSPVNLITTCYGNCGSPPITLANTNSTHSVAFNSSLTLFYQFQSQVNGFLLNVTTSVSKNYVNGQTLTIGAYTTSSNCIGSIPFSQSCPGLLQFSKSVNNPTKGQTGNSLIITGNSFPVSNGQWIAIALSGLYAPLDINDTNTNVAVFQTQGDVPALLSQTAAFNANYKMGLWAWISGNVVSGTGVPSGSAANCQTFAFVDCWLPGIVNSQCNVVNANCQAASGLIWAVALSMISIGILGYSFGKAAPNVRIPFGEMFIVIFLVFLFMETGLSLLFVWVPIFFFMIAALLFSKHTGRYF